MKAPVVYTAGQNGMAPEARTPSGEGPCTAGNGTPQSAPPQPPRSSVSEVPREGESPALGSAALMAMGKVVWAQKF